MQVPQGRRKMLKFNETRNIVQQRQSVSSLELRKLLPRLLRVGMLLMHDRSMCVNSPCSLVTSMNTTPNLSVSSDLSQKTHTIGASRAIRRNRQRAPCDAAIPHASQGAESSVTTNHTSRHQTSSFPGCTGTAESTLSPNLALLTTTDVAESGTTLSSRRTQRERLGDITSAFIEALHITPALLFDDDEETDLVEAEASHDAETALSIVDTTVHADVDVETGSAQTFIKSNKRARGAAEYVGKIVEQGDLTPTSVASTLKPVPSIHCALPSDEKHATAFCQNQHEQAEHTSSTTSSTSSFPHSNGLAALSSNTTWGDVADPHWSLYSIDSEEWAHITLHDPLAVTCFDELACGSIPCQETIMPRSTINERQLLPSERLTKTCDDHVNRSAEKDLWSKWTHTLDRHLRNKVDTSKGILAAPAHNACIDDDGMHP